MGERRDARAERFQGNRPVPCAAEAATNPR
jgi:hypothetical protein